MTHEDKDAVFGRTVRAHQEARNKLSALDAHNKVIAASAIELALALEQYPDHIHVSKGIEGTVATADARYVYSTEVARWLNPDVLRAHLAEYISAKQQKADSRRQVINLGGDDPGE